MIVCRRCRWAGVEQDLEFGRCPECGAKRFADNFELWLRRAAWGALLGFVAYLVIYSPLGR